MFLNSSINVCLVLVYGVVIAIGFPQGLSKTSFDQLRSQFSSDDTFPSSLWANDFISSFNPSLPQEFSNSGQGLNITHTQKSSYKVVVRKSETLPDGSVKTEEITRNSGEYKDGTPSHSEIFPAGINTDISDLFNSRFKTDGDINLFSKITENVPCPSLKSQNANVKCVFQFDEVSCDRPMNPGTTANAQCHENYKPAHQSQRSQITCLRSGAWDYPLINCIPVCGNSKEVGTLSPLIVDGKVANIGDFPWHAGLYYRKVEGNKEFWNQQCGGSLISDKFVLTAAHCVYNRQEKDVRIALGKFFRSWDQFEETEQKRNVAKIMYPREFYNPTLYFDVALLLMDSKIKLGEYVMPVCSSILDGTNSILNKQLYIVGWGRTENTIGGASSPTLLYNDVSFVPQGTCQKMIPTSMSLFDKICTQKTTSDVSVAQPGDSGGGLTAVVKGLHYIFGIVSGKVDRITMFTNITWPTHTWWIENEMKKYDSSLG